MSDFQKQIDDLRKDFRELRNIKDDIASIKSDVAVLTANVTNAISTSHEDRQNLHRCVDKLQIDIEGNGKKGIKTQLNDLTQIMSSFLEERKEKRIRRNIIFSTLFGILATSLVSMAIKLNALAQELQHLLPK